MQATVRTFDPHRRDGDLLLDDGSVLTYPASAFERSGLHMLRLGQRVRVETDDAGNVVRLTLATLPFRD